MKFYQKLIGALGMISLAYAGCSKNADLENSRLDSGYVASRLGAAKVLNVPEAMVHNVPGTSYFTVNAQVERIGALSRLGVDAYVSVGVSADGSRTCDLIESEKQIQSMLPSQDGIEKIIQETNERLKNTCSEIDKNKDNVLSIKEVNGYQLRKCRELINSQVQSHEDESSI